jgi:hypothetical protein
VNNIIPETGNSCRFLGTAMSFPGTKMLLGLPFVFLGMGRMLPGTPDLFLGTFWLLGKVPSFLGTRKWFLGISSVRTFLPGHFS